MSTYIFDIETGPRSRAELAECVPTFEAPANWKDPEKIRAYVAEKEAAVSYTHLTLPTKA